MADTITTVNTGTGALPNSTIIATRDASTNGHWQQVDVAPAVETIVAGSQHPLSVGTGSPSTLTVPATATHALISVDSGGAATGVRITFDSTTPTASAGHFIAAGDSMYVTNLSAIKLIGVTGTASVQVTYWKFL